MNEAGLSGGLETAGDGRNVARRDWLLLSLTGLLTVGILAGSVELIARYMFSASKALMANCMVMDDPLTGPRANPNTVCSEKDPETPLIEYRFNGCGHRAGIECGPKAPGTFRIVMTGSSLALGEGVEQDKTFAALLPAELTQSTGKKVEVYNEAQGWGFSHSATLRFDKVIEADPDLVLWVLNPADIEGASEMNLTSKSELQQREQSLPAKIVRRIKEARGSGSLADAMAELFGRTRTTILVRHFLYKSQSQFVKSYLMVGDMEAGYLKPEYSATWKDHVRQFEADVTANAARAKAAGVPLVVTMVPNRGQAAMISLGHWPSGFDPYKLDEELRAIVVRDGGVYLDILPEYRNVPSPEQDYFPVDGHPDAHGHATISRILAHALTSGAIPALKTNGPSQVALDEGR